MLLDKTDTVPDTLLRWRCLCVHKSISNIVTDIVSSQVAHSEERVQHVLGVNGQTCNVVAESRGGQPIFRLLQRLQRNDTTQQGKQRMHTSATCSLADYGQNSMKPAKTLPMKSVSVLARRAACQSRLTGQDSETETREYKSHHSEPRGKGCIQSCVSCE